MSVKKSGRRPVLTDEQIINALLFEVGRPKWVRRSYALLVGHCRDIIDGTCPGADRSARAAAKDLLRLISRTYRDAMEANP